MHREGHNIGVQSSLWNVLSIPECSQPKTTTQLENKSIVPCWTMHTGRILSHKCPFCRWS